MKSSVVFPLLLVLALAFASVVFTKADLEFLDVENPSRDPEQKYKECLQRCERHHEGQSFQERCHDDCKERRRQAEERRAHEQGGSRGREEEQRREEERAREEEQRKEHERGSGREREEQRQEEEQGKEQERGDSRGRQEQRRQEERARQKEEQREQERGGRGRHEEQQRQEERKKAGGSSRDSKKQYKACLSQCGRQSQGRSSQEDCRKQCKEKWHKGGGQDIKENDRKEFGEGETSPYVFYDQHFSTIIQSRQGRMRRLPRFTERSKLLKGIDNYRVLISETEPQAFALPHHYDADIVIFVTQGRGTASHVRHNKRETFNIRRGDVLVVPAGTTAYVINTSKNEKLIVAELVRPVNTPGQFETYFGVGGEEPESFYRSFSKEILEAAFNTKREKIERIFGQQRQGAMVKASEEQIRELSRHEEGGIWPFVGGESKVTANIFQQSPLKSNQYGQLYEVDGSNLHQLQDLDVAVSVANISQGSMSTLLYNSRATKIAIVVNGEGYLEMACPHLSQSQEGQQGIQQQGQTEERKSSPSYHKVTARLRRDVVVVIPAGHPHVAVASENQNLEIVSFTINSNNNERLPLAGRSNVINQLERTAKELAFGVPAKEVDEVLGNQEEEFFFKGPSQTQRRGQHESRADA